MDSPLAHVVQRYTELTSSLLDEWADHAAKVASKLDSDTYDADDAAADLATACSLATESWARLTSEALDALAELTGRQGEPYVVDSETFSTTLAGGALALEGPLVNGLGGILPAAVVSVRPPALADADTRFSLRADATACQGGTYVGTVVASKAAITERVSVWISVA